MAKAFTVDDTTRITIEMLDVGAPERRRERAELALANVAKRRARVAAQRAANQLTAHEAARWAFDTDALEAAAQRTLAALAPSKPAVGDISVHPGRAGLGWVISRITDPDHFGHPVAECWSPKGWLPWEPQIWGEGRFDTEAEAEAQAKILRDEAKAQIEASS